MALRVRKLLLAAASSLLTALTIGAVSAGAADAETDIQTLNRFIVTDSGNRVLTGSVSSNQITQTGWYVSNDDSLYYYYNDGSCATDETTLEDGYTYLFASDGALRTGWQTVEGKRYYYNAEIGTPVFGWLSYHNELYYVDEEAGKLTGVQEVGGVPYTFNDYGCVQTGWISYEDGSLYFYDENAVPASGWVTDENGTYYFTANGAASGLTVIDGSNYYFSQDKLMQTGWVITESAAMWADANGVLATGKTVIDGKSYYFDNNGVMQTGLVTTAEGTYYCGSDGVMLTGFQVISDQIYYFLPETGLMQTGWQTVGGKLYYFNISSGVMQTGWITADSGKFYLTENGAASGLTVVDGVTYYFDPETGVMQTGWQTIDGKLYCFYAETGAMLTGWSIHDTDKVYLTENGAAAGITEIDEETYYFLPSTGAMQTGWITVDGISRYFDPTTGAMTEVGHAEVQLDAPDYKQFDSQWANKTITYSTIGKVGCLVTAISMKYSYETGTATTPDKMLSKLSFSGDSLLWSSCTNLGYTVEDASGSLSQAQMQKIYNCLQNDTPVIIGAKKSNGGQHYVLVTGYTGSTGTTFSLSNFVINDPGSSTRSRLDEYLALYPALYKIIY